MVTWGNGIQCKQGYRDFQKEKNRRILSLSFCLASRAYGSVGTVEQDSYSYTPPEEEVEKGQTINK